jgi:hypothetical protein
MLVLTVVSAVFVLALPVRADEKPTEAYQKAMKDAADAMTIMRAAAKDIEDSGSGFQDYQPYEGATATVKASMATTLAYWQSRKVDDAIKLAQGGAGQVGDIAMAAKERDYRVLRESFTALGETCASCHMAHRVKLPDGTYDIK